jgi:xylose isomerase
MNDPIVDEVRRVRDAHAARFNYDLDAIFRDIKEREKQSGLKFIEGVARQNAPDQSPHLTGAAISVSADLASHETAQVPEH